MHGHPHADTDSLIDVVRRDSGEVSHQAVYDVLRTLTAAGLPAAELFAAMQNADVKQALMGNTQAAFERGAFGSPTFFVNDQIFFGKDRLREVEEEIALQGKAA